MLKKTLQKEEEKSSKYALETTGKHFWEFCKDNSMFWIINNNKSSDYKQNAPTINQSS